MTRDRNGLIKSLGIRRNSVATFNINRKVDCIDDFKLDDFDIINYVCHPTIKAPMVA